MNLRKLVAALLHELFFLFIVAFIAFLTTDVFWLDHWVNHFALAFILCFFVRTLVSDPEVIPERPVSTSRVSVDPIWNRNDALSAKRTALLQADEELRTRRAAQSAELNRQRQERALAFERQRAEHLARIEADRIAREAERLAREEALRAAEQLELARAEWRETQRLIQETSAMFNNIRSPDTDVSSMAHIRNPFGWPNGDYLEPLAYALPHIPNDTRWALPFRYLYNFRVWSGISFEQLPDEADEQLSPDVSEQIIEQFVEEILSLLGSQRSGSPSDGESEFNSSPGGCGKDSKQDGEC